MNRDLLASGGGRAFPPNAVLALVQTKSAITFDATADVCAFRDGVNDVYLDFNQLPNASQEFRNSAKGVLSWYAENRSPDHLKNMFQRLQHFFRALTREVSCITDVDLLNYRALLSESTAWQVGTLAGLLRKWLQLGYPGVGEDVELLLKQLRIKGNAKGVSVLTWDTHDGPFTHIETEPLQASLNSAYASGGLFMSDYVLAWLYILLGQRPKQHAALKVCDVQLKKDTEGAFKYSILIPSAKKDTDFSRAQLVERPPIEQFGAILVAYAESVRARFKPVLLDPAQAPLFPMWRSTRSSP